jgi:putative Mg2+ transporter-C (MgtC) family protein
MIHDWFAGLGAGDWLGPGAIVLRLGAAVVLSCLIGLDRELKDKPFGLRTNMLMGLGAASFCVLVTELLHDPAPGPNARPIDAGRVVAGVIGAIGFLGAGAIIQDRQRVLGAIGMACGFGLYFQAIAITLLALFVLTVLGFLERHGRPHDRSD